MVEHGVGNGRPDVLATNVEVARVFVLVARTHAAYRPLVEPDDVEGPEGEALVALEVH